MRKEINYKSLQVDGINMRDYPDFVDAYICYGEYQDGTELDDAALDELNNNSDLVYELVLKHLY